VAFSPDGRLLATGGDDGTPRLWDATTRQPVGDPLSGHTDTVLAVAFSPDGRLLATGEHDGTVRLWDTGTRQPVGDPFSGHTDWVNAVAFSPDGRLLATAGDGPARLSATPQTWIERSCALVSRNLSQDEWVRYVGADVQYVRHCSRYPSGTGADRQAPVVRYPKGR
jgi:WD40 repeat protein